MSTPTAASAMVLDPTTGLWQRPAANDAFIVEEVRGVYERIPVHPGDVVLDLGAHIGAASRLLLERGAASAIAVEADPANLEALRANLAGYSAIVVPAAVGAGSGQVSVYADPERPYLSTVVAAERGRIRSQVPMVAFAELLAEHRPTIVKIDIEGAEHALAGTIAALPEHVRVLAMEIHIRRDLIFRHLRDTPATLRAARRAAVAMVGAVEHQGFRCIRRKDKQARGSDLAIADGTGLAPMTKSIDAIWVRP